MSNDTDRSIYIESRDGYDISLSARRAEFFITPREESPATPADGSDYWYPRLREARDRVEELLRQAEKANRVKLDIPVLVLRKRGFLHANLSDSVLNAGTTADGAMRQPQKFQGIHAGTGNVMISGGQLTEPATLVYAGTDELPRVEDLIACAREAKAAENRLTKALERMRAVESPRNHGRPADPNGQAAEMRDALLGKEEA